MDLNRFERLLEAWGGEPARWPPHERAAALEFAARDPDAARRLSGVRRLDALLDAEIARAPGASLRVRVRAAAPSAGSSRWRRLAALAAAAGFTGAMVAGSLAGAAVAARETRPAPPLGAGDPAYEAARDMTEPADPGLSL
jgi:hypothetical protein